jgi:hypothetical protein
MIPRATQFRLIPCRSKNVTGIAMNKIILSLFLALAGAAELAGPREFKSDYFPLEKNIAVDIFAPGAVRAGVAGMDPRVVHDDSVRWAPVVDDAGDVFAGKVEGIAWHGAARDQLSAVLDPDDPELPAELCILALDGPWL